MQTRPDGDVVLREMAPADLPAAHALSREAGWAHRLEDWTILLRCGRGMVAEIGGRVVGTVLGFAHGPATATLGLVIVGQAHRSAGVGRKLMNAMLEQLAPRVVQLNATPDGLRLYESLDFHTIGSVHRHQGAEFSKPALGRGDLERLRPMDSGDLARVTELDQRATGFHRHATFAQLLQNAEGVLIDGADGLSGFAMRRAFGRGHLIGPVVATDLQSAQLLVAHQMRSSSGGSIRVDVPGGSGLGEWLQGLGLPAVDHETTMVRGAPPRTQPGAKRFALAGQALG